MTTLQQLRSRRAEILSLAAAHGASNLWLFGSVARETNDESSDIDIMVDLEPGRSLLDLGELQVELGELLGVEVDLVTSKGLRGRIRDSALKDARPL